jgi:ribosomal protein L34E
MNIVQFKMKLVDNLVGKNIDSLFDSGGCADDQHVPVHITDEVTSLCVWCALMSRSRQTRYQCAKCGIPLSSIGNGRVEEDCFTAAHETGDRLEMVQRKNDEMKKRVRNTKKKKNRE